MKVLITGAAGLVGSHLAVTLGREHQVTALTHAELDITDRDAVHRCVNHVRPEVIFNCAVLQVDDSERDPAKAEAVNVNGPRYLAEAAGAVGADIVQFGTQYVFAGEPVDRPLYTVEDELRPVNVYGQTKAACEQAVRETCVKSYVIRTSWVYGSSKASFLCTAYSDLRAGRRIPAIDDIWSSTTYVLDLIDRCIEIIRTRHYATYHIVNSGVCSYYDFALEAGRLAGLGRDEVDSLVEIVHERDMKRIAPRPRYTPLRCLVSEKLGLPPMRDWRDALAAYVSR